MSERRDPDDDLADLLADLDRTLGDLRHELRERERGGRDDGDGRRERRRGRSDRRRGGPTAREAERYGYRRRDDRGDRSGRDRPLPRPPSFSEMLRFTEEYTIPTIISVLETTIRSLELLRNVLRLADPDRSVFDAGDRRRSTAERLTMTGVGREALSGVDRALDDLREALSDLPPDAESRDIVTDARDLMGEIETRIEEAERQRERSRYGYREDRRRDDDRQSDRRSGQGRRTDDDGPVTIDVGDEADAAEEEETPQVDVDAELESIRKEVRGGGADGDESDEEVGNAESQPGGEDADAGDDERREDGA
jgi:hypothetical protein